MPRSSRSRSARVRSSSSSTKPGESFTATRYAEYWNQPYPYLEEYETRVIPDALTRAAALEAGDVDLIHTTNGDTIAKYRDDPENFPMLEETDFGETGYTLLHVTQEGSPLTDARVRCALAESTDAQAIIEQTQAGVPVLANGPFSPAQTGFLEDTGFPTEQNMEEAQAPDRRVQGREPRRRSASASRRRRTRRT